MDPESKINTSETITPAHSDSPWRSSQDQPVVHTVSIPHGEANPPAPSKQSFPQKLKAILVRPKFWIGLVVGVVVGLIALWFVQPARWWLVNVVGARNSVTITTIAPGEGQGRVSSLGHVAVMVDGKAYKTDAQGKLTVPHVPYGKIALSAAKAGYRDVQYGVTLDFDPFLHYFGGRETDDAARSITLALPATGIPVNFKVVDVLSGQPVTSGEFVIGDVVARPDTQGQVAVKIPGTDEDKVKVRTNFGGAYVDQTFDIELGEAQAPTITVVPGGAHYFVSKRSGTLDVYSSNLDGSNVQPLITGTGQETDAIAFAVSPNGKFGVLSSSRDGTRNSRGDMVQRIYVVDLATKQLTRVDEGLEVQFADWSSNTSNTLVYTVRAYDSLSAATSVTLRSVDVAAMRVYNFESADDIQVGTVGYDKVVYQKHIHSGPDAAVSPVLRSATVTSSGGKTLGDRTDFVSYMQLDSDRLAFKTEQDQVWHEYNLNTDQLKTISQPSSGSNTVQYVGAGGNGRYLVVDRIDGVYSLLVKDTTTGALNSVYGGDGLSGPVRLAGDVVTYRVVTPQETADYAVSLHGGKPRKISDVTASLGKHNTGEGQQRFRFY